MSERRRSHLPPIPIVRNHPHRLLQLFVTVACIACVDTSADGGGGDRPGVEGSDTVAATPRRVYERSIVFTTTADDSVLVVPWLLEATTHPGGVARLARGWLARNGEWEPFLRSAWSSPPNREPWRIVPNGPFRILVGEGDRLDRVFFEGGSRRLEVSLDETLAEWTGNRGGSFNVMGGGLILGDRRLGGRVLDVSQGIRLQEGTLGDWLFLVSGDSLTVVIQAPLYQEDEMAFQGWARDGFEELQWPQVRVEWAQSRAYEPARRDVPSILRLVSAGGELSGELRVLEMHLETRPGPGPLLPVDGIMEVQGTLDIDGRTLPVRGILRHRQP